ncbi:uncharacterized protein LOC112598587 [Melanaphis sacchari]|uniref:uncharacterized protein LOC112598587 n=1 Tax=Melanaphis sacchari TaxID=742174 RepID=UPI000DC13CD3|nr:uncharacterized protein LOC112598587 [Melanaphis sacchari]
MFARSKINYQKQHTGKSRMDDRGSSTSETNRLAVDINQFQKQQLQKTSIKNDGLAAPEIKKMSLMNMLASAERLSKNLERKMTRPIIKKESRMNVNEKQIKKVPTMMHAATVPRRSVFEVTKTRLLVPLTPEPTRLEQQCIREENITSYMPSNKTDVAVQTVPQNNTSKLRMCLNNESNPFCFLFLEKTLNLEVPLKHIVKKLDKFLRKNMKTTNMFIENKDNSSTWRIVVAGTNNHWKYFKYFSWFTIGVIIRYVVNYGQHYFQWTENSPLLLL